MIRPSRFPWRTLLTAFCALILAGNASAQGLISPVHGYISVEPFELRKEFVMRFDTLTERIGAESVTVIDASNRTGLEQKIGDWLEGKCPVEVDGKQISMERDRVHFVRPDPEKGLVVDDRESVPAGAALVGVVFAAALDGPPERVKVVWEVFPSDGSEAIVEAGARGQRAARKLTTDDAELLWENEAGLAVPELMELPDTPAVDHKGFWGSIWAILFFGLLGICVGLLALRFDAAKRRVLAVCSIFLILAGLVQGVVPESEEFEISTEMADEISYALLRNIYHAFDYRRESDIYDVLAKSAEGDLLTQIYLEVQRSLQVESQGGARVRVTDLDLRKCELEEESVPGAFMAECEWVAVGTVTHWGHTHDRVNRYRAKLTIGPRDGEWRMVGLELQSEERI